MAVAWRDVARDRVPWDWIRRCSLVLALVLALLLAWHWTSFDREPGLPSPPQYIEVYVDNPANPVQVSVDAQLSPAPFPTDPTPEQSRSRRCYIEFNPTFTACTRFREQLTVRLAPLNPEPVHWLVIIDDPTGDTTGKLTRTLVYSGSTHTRATLGPDLWTASSVEQPPFTYTQGSPPAVFVGDFTLSNVTQTGASQLVIELPRLMNEESPEQSALPQVVTDALPDTLVKPHLAHYVINRDVNYSAPVTTTTTGGVSESSLSTGPSTPPVTATTLLSPFGPLPLTKFWAPSQANCSVEVSGIGNANLDNYRLESNDGAAPVSSGFGWTGSWRLDPSVVETNVVLANSVEHDLFLAGIAWAAAAAAFMALLQEIRRERRHQHHHHHHHYFHAAPTDDGGVPSATTRSGA